MAFDFPSSPTNGQVFSPVGGPTYTWSSASGAWLASGGSSAVLTGPSDYRNKIINGDMSIDQRNAGALFTVPATFAFYSLDRWAGTMGGPGSIGMQRIVDPSHASEFAMKTTVVIADASLVTTERYSISQAIEGNMLRGLDWGQASAKGVTVSFTAWASSSFTLPMILRNLSKSRCWLGSFVVTTSPQRFTFTVPGDITGSWLYDNSIGIDFIIGLGSGSTMQAPATGWNAGEFTTLAGMSNFMASTSNILYLKDVQIEEGAVATPFERRPVGLELSLCQRYFWKQLAAANQERLAASAGVAFQTTTALFSVPSRVTMRATPSLLANELHVLSSAAVGLDVTNFAASVAAPDALNFNCQATTPGWSAGTFTFILLKTGGSSYFMANAEL